MHIWKVQEVDQKNWNTKLKCEWEAEVKAWTIKQDNLKYDCCKPRWVKLKMPPMEKA
jgi:hypothetical protein